MSDPANRFSTPRSTLLVDRFMTGFIKVGGLAIIAAVLAIMVFIAAQAVPLFGSAAVTPLASLPAGVEAPVALALDEWGERPVVLGRDGRLAVLDAAGGAPQVSALVEGPVTAVSYDPQRQRLAVGTRGAVTVADIAYRAAFEDGRRTVSAGAAVHQRLAVDGTPVAVAYAEGERTAMAGIVSQADDGVRTVSAIPFARKRGLMGGAGPLKAGEAVDLTPRLNGRPIAVLVDAGAETVVVATAEGQVAWFAPGDDGMVLRQSFRPFDDREDQRIASIAWVFGDVSLSIAGARGEHRIFSLHRRDGGEVRLFGLTKELPALPGPLEVQAHSVRNKALLGAVGPHLTLRYATTAAERWRGDEPSPVLAVALSAKYHRIAAACADGAVRLHRLDDPHPEAGFAALFGRVWYEGASEPAWTWQSSGANDDFEPKLSMVPLLFGTLKGTFYALLFAAPIALLAAVYTAEFMHPRFRAVVKPAVEIMASLPSVVLGFLAALWLAPLIEARVPSVICVLIALPLASCLIGWGWSRLPPSTRSLVRPGYEFIALVPVLLGVAAAAWLLGPALEAAAFTVPVLGPDGRPLQDAAGHAVRAADFARWWPWVTGLAYEQRNSLVVGVMMGFAVIPIIFTIAEDSLGNVPKALRSGSLALGASRWQTAWRVVVPTASAGIFSACMIGLGRAIGETMIVVMATGNTPIMDGNIFNGMRTLSANIAVELPEAPQHSTLYRTLFLGAFLLFALTFVINTAAEILRSHLREKYKTV